MKGRPPTPRALMLARGSRLDRREPEPEGDPMEDPMASIPAWLSAGAREHWMTIAPILKDMDVLMTSDSLALGMLCDAIVDYLSARDYVATNGAYGTYTNQDGEQGAEYQRPAVRHMHTAWANVIKACEKFALTPVDRGRVKVVPKHASGIATRKRA